MRRARRRDGGCRARRGRGGWDGGRRAARHGSRRCQPAPDGGDRHRHGGDAQRARSCAPPMSSWRSEARTARSPRSRSRSRTGVPVVGIGTWALDDVVDVHDPEAAVALGAGARVDMNRERSLLPPRPGARAPPSASASTPISARPGILELLAPVRERDGLVLEVGCGSGLLTRYLVDAGHRVLATDASPAMLELARITVPDAEAIDRLTLPDDRLPRGRRGGRRSAIALSYLPMPDAIDRALVALARALRPGGVFAIDLVRPRVGRACASTNTTVRGWVTTGRSSRASRFRAPDRYVRDMTTFVRNPTVRGDATTSATRT